MARPKRCRRICTEPDFDAFAPAGIPCAETVTLTLEEYETIRLIDLENCTHQQCAQQMDISRTTVTELYEKARYKIADSLIGGKSDFRWGLPPLQWLCCVLLSQKMPGEPR